MEKEIKRLKNKIIKIQNLLESELGNSTMDLVYELVELNLLLKKECNK